MTVVRMQQLLLLGLVAFADLVIAKASFPLSISLYQQLVSAGSHSDIGQRGVVQYDPSQSIPVTYTEKSQRLKLASGEGIYRIGLYDDEKRELGPAAFTKSVSLSGELH
jgi:hypothetical protein